VTVLRGPVVGNAASAIASFDRTSNTSRHIGVLQRPPELKISTDTPIVQFGPSNSSTNSSAIGTDSSPMFDEAEEGSVWVDQSRHASPGLLGDQLETGRDSLTRLLGFALKMFSDNFDCGHWVRLGKEFRLDAQDRFATCVGGTQRDECGRDQKDTGDQQREMET
jgi:hypothetical protein